MGRGGPRRGAGRPRKPLQAHVLAGTYRKDRHGALPAPGSNVVPMPIAGAAWKPEPDDLALMTEPGQQFVSRMLTHYEFSPAEGVLLVEAGYAVSNLDAVRQLARGGRTIQEAATIERLELGWQRQLAALLAQLKVEKA